MKLHASLADYHTEVELRREDERVWASVDGREYELELLEAAAGEFLLVSNGQVFNCRVDGRPLSGATVDVIIGTTPYAVTLTDPKRLRGAESGDAHAGGAAMVVAPMPGKVARVLVEVGDEIEAGAGIVVVEAMKMQNEMKSPKAGTVAALNVEVGATVNGGDVLAVIE